MEFNFNVSTESALKAERGLSTGVHKCIIQKAYLESSKSGNNMLTLELKGALGGTAKVFGMCVDEKWASGAVNYDYATWNEIALSAGMKTGERYELTIKNHKDEDVKVMAFKELENKTIHLGLYTEFDVYNGKEKNSRKIARAFDANGLTVAEKQAGLTEGKTIKALEKSISDYYTKAHKEFTPGATTEDSHTESAAATEISNDEDLI